VNKPTDWEIEMKKVMVYKFRVPTEDINSDVIAPSMMTRDEIARRPAEIIEESGIEVDESELDSLGRYYPPK
jgi:hypothetical protein